VPYPPPLFISRQRKSAPFLGKRRAEGALGAVVVEKALSLESAVQEPIVVAHVRRQQLPTSVLLDNLHEMVNDQQEPAKGKIVAGPPVLVNSSMQVFQQWSQRLKCISHELLVGI
jgi:hypothetical protein